MVTQVIIRPRTVVKTITVGTPIKSVVPSGASLASQTDVNFGTLSDNNVIKYDLASGKWVNTTIKLLIDSDLTLIRTTVTSNDSDILALQLADSGFSVTDASLQSQITAEISNRANGDSNLQANINIEESARGAADTLLQSQIDSNEVLFKATDFSLQSQINNEETVRSNADSNLLLQIDSNALNIANEVNARISGNASLQTQIDSNEVLLKGSDASLLSQIVSNDSDILSLQLFDSNQSISNTSLQIQIDSNALDIGTEVNSRISGDNALQIQIDSNEVLSKATDASLLSQIISNDSDILSLQLFDSGQTASNTLFQAQIDSNALNIANEVNTRISGDNSLQAQIDSNETLSKLSDNTLKLRLDSDEIKLAGIEVNADVTDTANVTAAGALMDTEVDADIKTLSLPSNTTISSFGATLIDDLTAAAARITLVVDSAGTSNTLAGVGLTKTLNTIDADSATTSSMGIAKYDSSNFLITSGMVSLSTVDGGTY